MNKFQSWKLAWALLDKRERRNAWGVLAIVVLAAFFAALMVGSIMPFLYVLDDPERIRTVPALAWSYQFFGFREDYSFLVALGMASLAVIILANLIQVARFYLVVRFSKMRMHSLSHRLLSAYLRQPYEYFIQKNSGDMATQILSESQKVVEEFFQPAAEVIASFLTVFAIFSLLLWINPLLTPIVFVLVGGMYGGSFALARKQIARLGYARLSANKERYRVANECLGGIKEIKILGIERLYVDRFSVPSKRMADTLVRSGVISQIPQYIMQIVIFGGVIVLTLALLTPEDLSSDTTLGGLLPLLGVFAFAAQRMMPELSKLYVGITQLNYGKAAVEAVYNEIQATKGAPDFADVVPKPKGLRRELCLDRIQYRYPGSDKLRLSDVSFTVRAGERIGIVGSTGSGKTTLADVILGLLRPSEGRILVDGKEIDGSNLQAWQQTVGYVPQDIFLTDSSIAMNIAFGVAEADIDFDRLKSSATIAQLEDFITAELPNGFQTTVGERGVRLSGGQKQRIGIARALYHDADLILFDEATSALDNATEREVIAAIEALPGDKTVIMIAHRLSTV